MRKAFAELGRWCAEHGIPEGTIKVVIDPQTPEAMVKTKIAWDEMMRGFQLHPTEYDHSTIGQMYGIPFEYKRP